jgi:CRISPR-associated exonuclease Cas4
MVEEDMLRVSDIAQYFYCPRKVYFMRTLGIAAPPRHKMKAGKEEHRREHRRVKERKTIYGFKQETVEKVLHNVPIESPKHHLHGRVDTVIILQDKEIIPVEVKHTSLDSIRRNWREQITAYALLLETKFDTRVRRGIFYFPSKRKVTEIEITASDKEYITHTITSILNMIKSEKMPPVHKGQKCSYCEMQMYCT